MSNNIIKDLVAQDKKVRLKLQALKEKYDTFLLDLNSYRTKEEHKFSQEYEQEVTRIKLDYKKHLAAIEVKLKTQSETMNKYNEIANFEKELLTLFNHVIKVK